MRKHQLWASAAMLFLCLCNERAGAQDVLDLSGQWEFQADRADEGVTEKWYGVGRHFCLVSVILLGNSVCVTGHQKCQNCRYL